MLLRQEVGDGVDVLAVTGPVAQDDARTLLAAVGTAITAPAGGPGHHVVLDLRDVTSLAPDAVEALEVLAGLAHGWPRASLCLCGAPPEVAHLLPCLSAHATRAEAVAHLDRRLAVTIEHGARGPAQARRVVQECAAALGLGEAGDDLVLVVSEIVTNAVRHGSPPVRLQVVVDGDLVVVQVADGSPSPPVPRDADEQAEGGRGMALVDLLAAEHGVRRDPPGKTVWASVRRPAAAPSG